MPSPRKNQIWETEKQTSQVLLTIDFKHPDMEPEDDFLDPRLTFSNFWGKIGAIYFSLRLWEVTVGEGGRANYQLRPELMS